MKVKGICESKSRVSDAENASGMPARWRSGRIRDGSESSTENPSIPPASTAWLLPIGKIYRRQKNLQMATRGGGQLKAGGALDAAWNQKHRHLRSSK
jgi:hypothetical protein